MAASPRFLELLKEMENIHIAKNAGYSGKDNPDPFANFRMSERFGISSFLGCLVRMSDKFIRVQNLVKNKENNMVNENLKDTLIDLANYAIIAICLLEEQENNDKI